MTRRITLAAFALVLVFASAWASPTKMTAEQMATMKATMSKCAVCKNMVTNLDQLMPSMSMEVSTLNNGVAIIHSISDPTKMALYRTTSEAIAKSGAACMTMTDAQAKTDLCPFCQDMRTAMKAGAKMSNGKTTNGDIMVLTSDDPAVQTQIASVGQKCVMMGALAAK